MYELVVNVSDLYRGGATAEIRREIHSRGPLTEVPELTGEFSATIRAMKGDGDVIVLGTLQADITLECRRCLAAHRLDAAIPLEGRFINGASPEADPEGERFDPEAFILDEAGNIDLTDLVRQTVISWIPPDPLCSDNCLGLCPVCGNNLNERDCGCKEDFTDHRWEPLREIMARMGPATDRKR